MIPVKQMGWGDQFPCHPDVFFQAEIMGACFAHPGASGVFVEIVFFRCLEDHPT